MTEEELECLLLVRLREIKGFKAKAELSVVRDQRHVVTAPVMRKPSFQIMMQRHREERARRVASG